MEWNGLLVARCGLVGYASAAAACYYFHNVYDFLLLWFCILCICCLFLFVCLAGWLAGRLMIFFFCLNWWNLNCWTVCEKKNTEWLVAWFVFYNVRMWVCVRVYVRVCAFGWRRCWILLMMTMMAMVIMMMIVCKYWWCWHFKFCFFFSFSCYCVIFTVFLLFLFFLLLLCYTKFVRFFTLKNLNLLYKKP